jgi:hypothetical protein
MSRQFPFACSDIPALSRIVSRRFAETMVAADGADIDSTTIPA